MTLEPITTTADYHVQQETRDIWSVTKHATGEEFVITGGLCTCQKLTGFCAHKIMVQVADTHPRAILPAGFSRVEITAPPVAKTQPAENTNTMKMKTPNRAAAILFSTTPEERISRWLEVNGALQ